MLTMDVFLEELTTGLPDTAQMARIIIRLTAAALLGQWSEFNGSEWASQQEYERTCWLRWVALCS